ncbi:MAG TPA: hypothetical protein VHC39_11045 [Rhizomicrobium sp.]|nr:hypothetical protein [Rhizomicrobium sp.]
MVKSFGQAVPLEKPTGAPAQPPASAPLPKLKPSRFGRWALLGGSLLSLFWVGTACGFIWGMLGPQGLAHLTLAAKAAFIGGIFIPPLLFMGFAAALARSAAMTDATRLLLATSERLFAADETAASNAARLARVVRRELDGLNTGLDVAFQRMRTLEAVLEKQISALDDAGARAQVRSDTIAARFHQENTRLETLGDQLTDAAGRAGETVAGRAAQLKATMESAEGTLKMATQSLEVQAAGFRAAITLASEAPLEAAKSLEAQGQRIQDVADAAMARAEFVLARHEKHRAQMGELVEKLRSESEIFEAALSQQRVGMENAIQALGGEARRFETVTGDAERHLELIMSNAAARANQLTNAFAREAERLKESSEAAAQLLATLSAAIKDAGEGARTLIGESSAQAKHDARLLVGEAMAECERLLRASGEMSAEAGKIRALLSETTREVEKHLIRLPGLAQEEARRVRQMMASETEQILDLSARTMSTLHARSTGKLTPPDAGGPMKPAAAEPEPEGLKGLARKLTTRKSGDKPKSGDGKGWEMKTLLAAAEQDSEIRLPRVGVSGLDTAATLGALELALADMAIDLSALDTSEPSDEDWKRYLAGDRALFARRLSGAIDDQAVDRITTLYRDDKRFHDAADAYLAEFETLLTQARQGDGGGLLTSTLLSADTGKVYLAIAYALGRL